EQSGAMAEGVLNVLGTSYLLRMAPVEEGKTNISPGSVFHAVVELWGIAAGESYCQTVAERGRAFQHAVARRLTDATSAEVDEDLQPADFFNDESFATGFMLALDHSWVQPRPEYVEQVNTLLGFFVQQGLPDSPAVYEIDGTPVNANTSAALVALNGAAAGISTIAEREEFIRTVWLAPIPTGVYRFYDGMNRLLSMLYLSGELRGYH